MNDEINKKRGRGRPAGSKSFRIVPVHHPQPDAKKLGRAFLALAQHLSETEANTEQALPKEDSNDAA